MADQLYLSIWLRGFSPVNMLRHYEKLLELFPFSSLSKVESTLRIYAVAYSEPPVLEIAVPPPVDVKAIIAQAQEFQNVDSCYELETSWDLWVFDREWKLGPARVVLSCFGPAFEGEDDANIRIDFGLEDQFLPRQDNDPGLQMIRANIQSLLRLVHDVDDRLKTERRLLWSETGENFALKLQESLDV